MKFTPHTTPNLLFAKEQLSGAYQHLKNLINELIAAGAPASVLEPLYTALQQFRYLNQNLDKSYTTLRALELIEQGQMRAASRTAVLPKFSYRVDIDEAVEVEDTTEEKARELYVKFDMAGHNVRLYQRPVTSTDPEGWETIDWNYDLDGLEED